MFEYKKMSKNELEQVIKNASLKIGVNEVILEKDYWVCFVLNYLFSKCKWKEAFTFKDGVNLLSVNELQKYTLIKIFNFSIILLSFLCHVKIL